MTETTAGRALLADPTMLTDDGEEAAEEAIAAIEREAAAAERERIRDKVGGYRPVKPGWAYWREVILQYILAEPSDD